MIGVYFNPSQKTYREFDGPPDGDWVFVKEALPAPPPDPNWQGFINDIADLYRVGEQRNFPLFASIYHLVMRCLDRQVTRQDLEWLTFTRHIELASVELIGAELHTLRQALESNHMEGVI